MSSAPLLSSSMDPAKSIIVEQGTGIDLKLILNSCCSLVVPQLDPIAVQFYSLMMILMIFFVFNVLLLIVFAGFVSSSCSSK